MVDTKKSLETLRWLKEADDESLTHTGGTFGGTQIMEIPDIDDIATLRKAEAKLGEMNQKLKEEKEWLRGERVSSTPNVVSRLKPHLGDSSISSTATSGERGSNSAHRGSPGAMVSNPAERNSFKFGSHDENPSFFQFGVKQGNADCLATFLKKKRTIQALVSTTYPDGTQKKVKEAVSEDCFIGKIEAKKPSGAAIQDQGTEVLRTDNEVDQEADLTDGGVSGIIRLNISSEVAKEPELKEEIVHKDEEVNDKFLYLIYIGGIVVGDTTLTIPLTEPLYPIMSVGEIMIIPNPVDQIEEGWEQIGQATFYSEPNLTNYHEPISFEPIIGNTISKVILDPTHTLTARPSSVEKNRRKLSTSAEEKKSPIKPTPISSKKAATAESSKAPTKPSTRKKITGPAMATPSNSLFDPPDVRRRITRSTKTSTSATSAVTTAGPSQNVAEDRDKKDEDLDIELHPRDEELNMELLDYEPTNVSRGSSLLDDTDTDVKVNDNPRD